jgi:hypothetical protein
VQPAAAPTHVADFNSIAFAAALQSIADDEVEDF